MPQIFAYYTCTRVKWECDDPVEEHGWIDRCWSATELYESRNDVSPVINLSEDDPELAEEVQAALDWLPGGYESDGNGTFSSKESDAPFDSEWSYSYDVHFTRKFVGAHGWCEEPWIPPLG